MRRKAFLCAARILLRMENSEERRESITKIGNPRKPAGDAGRIMLGRMNESHANLTSWAISLLMLDGGDEVLDIGCGGGAALRKMSGKITSGHLTGVDYSDVSVSLSRENNADGIRTGKMNIVRASVEALPFEDISFDKIITVESFYFWPNPSENLREVCRVLKHGGRFALAADVYTHAGMSDESVESIKKYELYAPTADEFTDMFLRAGFSKTELHTEPDSDRIVVLGIK